LKRVLLQAGSVTLAGLLLSLAANAISPRGIKLTRDYFPTSGKQPQKSVGTVPLPVPVQGTATNDEWEKLSSRLSSEGLHLITGEKAHELYNDPRREIEQIVFIDARPDEAHYREGHIPGAYQFDRYHPENYLPIIMPVCESAQQIIVYCNGGHCEDSEFAARMMKDELHIAGEKLLVYGGGISEWSTNKWPVEIGERKSGNIKNGSASGK
jgi:rhodanese-related sulfurtransferase